MYFFKGQKYAVPAFRCGIFYGQGREREMGAKAARAGRVGEDVPVLDFRKDLLYSEVKYSNMVSNIK